MSFHRIFIYLFQYKYILRLVIIVNVLFGSYALYCYFFQETTLPKTSPKLFCFVLTNPVYFSNRTQSIYNTWAKQCDNFKFISLIPDIYLNKTHDLNDSIELDYPFPLLKPKGFTIDVYKKLTDKIYLTLIELYSKYNDYDWYLKADDDTFVFVENLRDFIYDKPLHKPIMYGYNLKTWLR
jgi:glycoprotein-N-acetylgalactosamine 3-beta-galactosyltransferase